MPKSDPSLDVYWGGFLYNDCTPLEITLNWCSMACAFCFANLNDPDRRSNMKQLMGLLGELWQQDDKGQWKRKSYAAHLLREGYPIAFSNHVDPLANNNEFQTFPIVEVLQELKLPFTIATKGGRRFYDLLDILDKPIVFYMSIEQYDDVRSRKIAPGAPVPSQRIEMAAEAVRRGHQVLVGINPVVPSWLPDPEPLVKDLAAAGVYGTWIQPLHLSHKQIKNMPQRDKDALGEEVIKQGLYPSKHPEVDDAVEVTWKLAQQYGLECFDTNQPYRSEFFKPYQDLYPKRFPVMQEFINWCWDNLKPGDPIYWPTFRDFFVPKLPKGVWGLRDHINAVVIPEVLYGKMIPQRMNYKELFWYIWNIAETLYCPANLKCFAWAGDPGKSNNDWVRIVDDDNNPILIFLPEGYEYDYNRDSNNNLFTSKHPF